jgi:hypothetical protein
MWVVLIEPNPKYTCSNLKRYLKANVKSLTPRNELPKIFHIENRFNNFLILEMVTRS